MCIHTHGERERIGHNSTQPPERFKVDNKNTFRTIS